MSNNLHVGNLGIAATGNDRLKLVEPPGSVEPFRVFKDRDPDRSPEARPKQQDDPGTPRVRAAPTSGLVGRFST
jgi:hypothetical protein